MILDRYLLRQFVQIFVICFLSLTGLYVVIDAFGHLDHFSAYAAEHGNLLGTIAQYYGYRSLSFFDRTSGMLAMIAAIFTVTWLERHQELTAMLAAGISKFRVIKPLLIAAIVVSLLGVANRELVIPHVRDELTRDTKDLGGDQTRDLQARYDGRTDILISGEKTVVAEQRIIKPTFVLPASLARYGKKLVAKNAYCQAATPEHPSGYLVDGVSAPRKIDRLASLTLDGEPLAQAENLSVAEALRAYTAGAAYALGLDDAGVLREGGLGDLVMFDRDPFKADWVETPAKVVMTVAGGQVVYDGRE